MCKKAKKEIPEDLKQWYAISCPVKGMIFDKRTLELLDANHDGHVRTDEVQAAIAFVKEREGRECRDLETIRAELAELAKAEPPDPEKQKLYDAAAALAAIEPVLDAYFLPAEDAPFITEEPPKTLPLDGNVNVRFLDGFNAFRAQCVVPEFGEEKKELSYQDWQTLKAKAAPYRGGPAPAEDGSKKAKLEEEEKLVLFRAHLEEFLANFVTMDRLYSGVDYAVFQTGVLRIDGREMNLCFHVENEGAHSALSGKSNCCVIYLKLTRPADGATASICAVVTAGTVGGLYVGRNGVFYDRDGVIWEAVITKVVEHQVSLVEAFFMPWRKIGEAIAGAVKKFIGDKQAKATANVTAGTANAQAGGAAMASSVAAIGIGIGMVGAAAASLIAVIKDIHPWWMYFVVIGAVIAVVSVPSVILCWFKLRKRDLGAILNAGGWAVNRPMRFSMSRARKFTKKR